MKPWQYSLMISAAGTVMWYVHGLVAALLLRAGELELAGWADRSGGLALGIAGLALLVTPALTSPTRADRA